MIKKLTIIAALIVSSAAYANKIQFTGGNYVYADESGLTFNLEPSIFNARAWKYEQAGDSANSEFSVNLPLRTKYTSEFHGFQALYRNGLYHAGFSAKQSFDNYYIQPVYYQKTWVAAAGWGLRLGGMIRNASSAVSTAVRACFQSKRCIAGSAYNAASAACFLNYYFDFISMPGTFCSEAGDSGWHRDEDGKLKRNFGYELTFNGGSWSKYNFKYDFSTPADARSFVKPYCDEAENAAKARFNTNNVGRRMADNLMSEKCVSWGGSSDASWAIYEKSPEWKEATLDDIVNIAVQDFKKNPNEYINANGPLGTSLKNQISAVTAGYVSSTGSGTFSMVGSQPYRNPVSGQTVQDSVTISSAQNSSSPQPSGKLGEGKSGSPGKSTITNITNITNINRSDVEATSEPPKSTNSPNNGDSSASDSSQPDKPEEKQPTKNKCDEDIISCMEPGELPEEAGDIEVPVIDISNKFKADNFISANGVCPQPETFTVPYYGTVAISYDPMCRLAELIRGFVMLSGALTAAAIIFRRG